MYRERIETVRDPEVVNQWLEKMKKATRYTWKLGAEGEPPVVFESVDEARAFLLSTGRDRAVKAVESARFQAKLLESLPPGEIRRAIDGQLERQRRFPLDTANALRGRLRREGFTIFKKGSKGISYVCAVKRKFRVPGQSFAESIGTLIGFIEANPMITVRELAHKLLGLTLRPEPPLRRCRCPPRPPLSSPAAETPRRPPAAETAPAAAPVESTLTPEEQEKVKRVTMDLRWLVQEGYVTEFADGRLFTPPPMPEARIKAAETAEGEEHDPENFPDAPAASPAPTEPAAPPPAAEAVPAAPAAEPAPAAAEPAEAPAPAEPAPPPAEPAPAPVEPAPAPAPEPPPDSPPAGDGELTKPA